MTSTVKFLSNEQYQILRCKELSVLKDFETYFCLLKFKEAFQLRFKQDDEAAASFLNYRGALFSIAQIFTPSTMKLQNNIWNQLQVERMLSCFQLLSMTNAVDQIHYGITQQVLRVIDHCIDILKQFWE